ncbi:hypothetical protein M0R72_00520 [Candidatus Pacearchaeota archaeon]|jgi:hypothetical protein|nr:hypothetical protein [Candidatus Pacearchaeota archaeon]
MLTNISSDVNQAFITYQVYGLLRYQARRIQNPISYGVIGDVLGIPHQWGSLPRALTAIAEDDFAHERPILSSIVISAATGMPGQGWWDLVARLGLIAKPIPDKAFWEDQFSRVISKY